MGYVSDRVKSKRFGRRKPFILVGAPLLSISFIMMFLPNVFLPPNPNQVQLFVWLLIWVTSFNWFYGFLITPYQAMMPEIFSEKHRLGASLSENVFNFIGTIYVAFLSFDILFWRDTWIAQGSGPSFEYLLTIVVLGILTIGFYLPSFFVLPTPQKFIPHPNYKKDLKYALKNKNYLWYVLFIGVSEAGIFIAVTILLDFFDQVLFVVNDLDIIAAGVLGLVLLVFVVIWIKISKKYSIHKALSWAFVILMLTLPCSVFLLFLSEDNLYFSLLFVGFFAAGLAGEYLFQYVILGNIVEEDEIRTGVNHSGLYHGLLNAPENVFQGLGLLITGLLYLLPPIKGGLSGGLFWWGPVSALLIFISLLIFRKIKVDLKEIIKCNKDLKVEGELQLPKSLAFFKKISNFFKDLFKKKKKIGKDETSSNNKDNEKKYHGRLNPVKKDDKGGKVEEKINEKSVEPTKKADSDPENGKKDEEEEVPGPQSVICDSCGREFKSERGLKIHKRSCKGI